MSQPEPVNGGIPTEGGLDSLPANHRAADTRLRKSVVNSLVWSLAGFGTLQVLRFVFNLVLTRLLLPEAFGLMALLDLFIFGLIMFTDVGLGLSIVRSNRGDDPHYLNVTWSVQAVRGLGLWLAACALAWPLAGFYETPGLDYFLPVLGLTALINGFNSVNIYTSERNLSQARLVLLQVGCYLISMAVVLAYLVWIDLSVWGLVVGRLVGTTLEMFGSHLFLPGPRCRFAWDREVVSEILHFGKWIFVSTACTFLADQADRLIIGKVTSLGTLGVYNLAVQLAMAGKLVIIQITSRVVFPLYSKVVQRGVGLETIFQKVHPWAAGFGAFITAGLISSGPDFIRCLFRPQYAAAGWMLQLVSVGGWLTMLVTVSGCLLWVLNNARAQAVGMVVKLLASPLCAWLGYQKYGLAGMIWGFTAAELMRYGVIQWVLRGHGLPILRLDLFLSGAILLNWLGATWIGSQFVGPGRPWLAFVAEVLTVVFFWLGLAIGARWLTGKSLVSVLSSDGEQDATGLEKCRIRKFSIKGRMGRVFVPAGLALVMALTLLSAGAFLPRQSLWSDEATQLGGIELGPIAIVPWLTDPNAPDVGVIRDRMPPLSYWVGWGWSQLFGLNEVSLRWLGVTCATLAAGFVFWGTRTAFGLAAAVAAGALFALSPNVSSFAVEIRAYPLLLLTSAGAFSSFLSVLASEGQGRRHWILLTVWLSVGVFTHFFGFVCAGAMLLALLLVGWKQFKSIRPVLIVGAVLACCGVFLLPFIRGAIINSIGSEAQGDPKKWYDVWQLLYRLLAHPAMLVHPVTIGVVFATAMLLIGAGFRTERRSRSCLNGIQLALASGLGVSIVAHFVVHSFSPAKYTYACWALPLVFGLLGAGLAAKAAGARGIAATAAVLLLLCELSAGHELWLHGDYFAHNPYHELRQVLDELPAGSTAIVHEGGSDYFSLFFPIQYEKRKGVPQFVLGQSNSVFGGQGLDTNQPESLARLQEFRWLVVVNSRHQKAADIVRQIHGGNEPVGDGEVLRALERSEKWRRIHHRLCVAFVAAEIVVLQRWDGTATE